MATSPSTTLPRVGCSKSADSRSGARILGRSAQAARLSRNLSWRCAKANKYSTAGRCEMEGHEAEIVAGNAPRIRVGAVPLIAHDLDQPLGGSAVADEVSGDDIRAPLRRKKLGADGDCAAAKLDDRIGVGLEVAIPLGLIAPGGY